MPNVTNPVQNIYTDTALEERSRKCKRMGLNTEDNLCVHNLLFAGDPVLITAVVWEDNYIGKKWKKNTRNGGLKLRENGIFKYRSSRGISDQREYNCNCKTVEDFRINSSR
jgi:hypothetical protein